MGFGIKLARMFAGSELDKVIGTKIEEALKESASGDWQERREKEDREWRPITSRNVKLFNPLEQFKMQKIAYYLYDKNPLAHRMIERYKDFVVGDGLTYDCSDPEVLVVVDNHWNDPENFWEKKQSDKMGELGIYGEQAYPSFVNDVTGHVRLGYIDPEKIIQVNTDPNNAEKRISLIANLETEKNTEGKPFKIIHLDENIGSNTYDYLMGDVFFFTINSVANMPRGRSDLLPIADSIDTHEQFLFNHAERTDILSRIIYDLKFIGKSDKEIKEFLKDFHIPRSNEVFGHNEKVELKITVPELASQDTAAAAKLHFNHIMGGAGFPGHWFAQGEGLTRATAFAMDLPTKKQLKSRQKVFKWMVSYIFRYVIHQAIIHKQLAEEKKDVKVTINLPKIEEKETEAVARALVGVTNSLVIGTEEGWITPQTAKKVYANILTQLGQEVEVIKETEKQSEAIDKKLDEIYMKHKEAMKKKKADMPEGDDDETN